MDLVNSSQAYMVPIVYLPLEVMPMTASRKVDRRQLRNIAQKVTSEELALRVSVDRSDYPQLLQEGRKDSPCYEQSVRVYPFGLLAADSNVLRSGGDSLTAMKVVILANKQNNPVRVTSIFPNPALRD